VVSEWRPTSLNEAGLSSRADRSRPPGAGWSEAGGTPGGTYWDGWRARASGRSVSLAFPDADDRIELTVSFAKERCWPKEAVYVAFPFAVTDASYV